jgi:hypothetical protein
VASNLERARSAVGRRIRAEINASAPPIRRWRHLAATITTGLLRPYEPERVDCDL